MSYEVTATRKRPQVFEQLAGQEFVSATLEKSLETGRIAHAYLFSGPRGCGKTSTARILAKALNCEKGPTAHPCGECDSCKAITAGSSFDVIEIDGASNTSVENVRQIKDEVLFPPNSGHYKIYIIDEVHMLSTSAFNALLKTIEEPPPYVVFIFATTEQHKVPATIKSRCQQFTFRLVPSDVIVGLLAGAAKEIGVKAEDEALLWIARESGGSVRDAYTLFDQIVSFSEGCITAKLIKEKLGLVGQDQMNLLFGSFVRGDTAAALSSLDAILSGGVSPEQFVVDMVEFCRALLLIKNGVTKESLLGAPLSSFDSAIAESLSCERIEQILSIFLSTYRNLKESIDPRYELELAVAKGSHINEYIAPSELANAVESLRRQIGKGTKPASTTPRPVVSTATVPHANPQTRSVQPEAEAVGRKDASVAQDLGELKKAVVADIRKNNVMLATTIDKSKDWHVSNSTHYFSVGTKMEFDHTKRYLGIIAEVIAQKLGAPQKLEVLLAGEQGPERQEDALGAAIPPQGVTELSDSSGQNHFASTGQGPASSEMEESQPRRFQTPASPAVPDRFSDSGTPGMPIASAEPDRSALSGKEEKVVSMVEKCFKGNLVGISAASAGPDIQGVSGGEGPSEDEPYIER
ncbi:MAG: DNA polymerase III subunit gamma/tau [Spirochaetaceae bacterium]|nr:DNA polymerase III subunit gamma/tau [Spirochaetaceae bacterium]